MSKTTKKDLEAQLAAVQAQLAALATSAIEAVGKQQAHAPVVVRGEAMVGVRNISSYTVGIAHDKFGEINLHAAIGTVPDPSSVAAVPHAWWMIIRSSPLMQKGMLIRDDEALGSGVSVAPADREQDIPATWAQNAVIDPQQWIESKTEQEIREAIQKMTSEPSIRRLSRAVDDKIFAIGEEKYKEDPERAKKAVRDLPAMYRLVDELTMERLDEMNPMRAERANENKQTIRF